MYERLVEKMLKLHGRKCIISPRGREDKITVKAFVNPLLYKNKMYIGGKYLPDGFYDGGHYLYIGEAKIRLDDMPLGTIVECGENKYSIKHAEQYFMGDKALYSWAVLQIANRGDRLG